MAAQSSFDIVSKFDPQELRNAIDQAMREITTRYDLKDSKTTIEQEDNQLVINTSDEMTLRAVRDILESKAIRRDISLKVFDYQKEEDAAGGRIRQTVKLRQGLNDDMAKKISKDIRTEFKKVKPQIQGDVVKAADYDLPLQFTNYR